MKEINELEQIIESAISKAKELGASAVEVGASVDSGLSTSVRLGEVETVEFNQDTGMGITVYFGQKKGSASTSDTSADAIAESVEAACHIAKYTQADPCSGLADASLMAKDIPDLDLHHPWTIEPENAIEIALECEKYGLESDAKINNSEGASLSSHESYRVYGNSHGFIGGYATTRHGLSCVLIGQDQDEMQRDYYYTTSRESNGLESAKIVGQKAAEKTLMRLNARKLKTQKAPIIFSPEMSRGLIGHFFSAISGSAIYRKSSFLLDHLNKSIFPEFIQLSEKPHILKGLGSAPFDAEGVTTQDRAWVRDGVLQSYVLNSYSARKLDMQTTGNAGGLHNVFVSTSDKTQQTLLKEMGTGFLVTELMGQGVNKVNGNYSRGASGFWIENGDIQFPVQEVTIAGNLKDMFSQIVAVGNDVDHRANIKTGSILVEEMTIAGE